MIVYALMFCAGALVGMFIVALLVAGRDPADERDAERRAGHW